jgi:hypothetical protein
LSLEFLEWPDGATIELPETTTPRAAQWAARFREWIRDHDPEPEVVERAMQGVLNEERRDALLKVERTLVQEI